MIDRNRDKEAFRGRALEACGYEFVKLRDVSAALNLGRDAVRELAKDLRRVGGMYSVADLADTAYDKLHPTDSVKPRKCG